MNIKNKLLLLSLGSTAATTVILLGMLQIRKDSLNHDLQVDLDNQARTQCALIAKDVYAMLKMQNENTKQKVRSDLNVARDVLEQNGKIRFADDTVTWKAVNQYTKETKEV